MFLKTCLSSFKVKTVQDVSLKQKLPDLIFTVIKQFLIWDNHNSNVVVAVCVIQPPPSDPLLFVPPPVVAGALSIKPRIPLLDDPPPHRQPSLHFHPHLTLLRSTPMLCHSPEMRQRCAHYRRIASSSVAPH